MTVGVRLYQAMLFAFILAISFFTSGSRTVDVSDLRIPVNYILLLVIAVSALPLLLVKGKRPSAKAVFLLFTFISVWASFSGVFRYNYLSSTNSIMYTAGLSWLLMFFGFVMSKIVAGTNAEKVLTQLSRLLTIVFAIYASYFVFKGGGDIQRLQGPLGLASVIHVPILLVLSVHVYNIMKKRAFKSSILFSLLTIMSLFLTNSRAGVLSLFVFLFLVFMQKSGVKSKIAFTFIVIICAYAFASFVNIDRLTKLDDTMRQQTTEAALSVATQSASNFMFGTGFGTLWSLSSYEALNSGILHHAHSVFLELFTELGVVGVVPFLTIIIILLREFRLSLKNKNALKSCLLAGILGTIFPSFFTDLYLFTNFEISLIWWLFLFVTLTIPTMPEPANKI